MIKPALPDLLRVIEASALRMRRRIDLASPADRPAQEVMLKDLNFLAERLNAECLKLDRPPVI